MAEFKLDAQTTFSVGQPVPAPGPHNENVAPSGYVERLEWVRKSYERFLAKIIEKEALMQAPPADIG